MTDGWDDKRLAAAFAARAAATPPHSTMELAAATLEQIRSGRSARAGLPRLEVLAGLAAVLVVGALIAFGGGFRDRDRGLPASSPTSMGTTPEASSGATGGPPDADVITVGVALGVRDALTEPAEIRVGGWIRGGVPVPCPDPGPGRNPARLDCLPAHPWIVGDPADAGPGVLNIDPKGPAFRPSFALVDAGGIPDPGAVPTPIEIVVTGHFHDRRAALCQEPDCALTFVVDRIDRVDGVAQPIDSVDLAVSAEKGNTTSGALIAPHGRADAYDDAVTASGSELTIVSRRTMSIDGLLRAEPALAGGWPGIGTATVVTSITAFENPGGGKPMTPHTYLAPDGSPFLYEMTRLGPVRVIALPVEVFLPGLTSRVGDPIAVAKAIDLRDNDLDDSELLVRGFAWAPPPLFCTLIRPSLPVLDQCPTSNTWLAANAPPPARRNELLHPDGPAINLVIPPESANLADLTTTPRDVVVLGHFDDHRSATCPAGMTERCRHNFIVDEILDPDHLALEATAALSGHPGPSNTPRGNATWASAVAGLTDADRADRLISAFPVAVAALSAFEPDTLDTQAVAEVETVWLVHFLDVGPQANTIVRTRIVTDAVPGDGTARVYDLTADGVIPALAAAP